MGLDFDKPIQQLTERSYSNYGKAGQARRRLGLPRPAGNSHMQGRKQRVHEGTPEQTRRAAYEEAQAGTPIVLLIPARTDTTYFHEFIYHKAEVRFIRGRLRFTDEDGNAADPAPFPSMLVIYNGEAVRNEPRETAAV